MAANVSGFNTVFTYDIWRPYIKPGRPDAYYLKFGRIIMAVGVLAGVGTAFIAAGFSNIMAYLQTLFSFFNAPLFATFIVGLVWKKMTPWAGFWGLVTGTTTAVVSYLLYKNDIVHYGTELNATFWGAGLGFVSDVIVSVVVTLLTVRTAKSDRELAGLVRGLPATDHTEEMVLGDDRWFRNPVILGVGALSISLLLYIPLWSGAPHEENLRHPYDHRRAVRPLRAHPDRHRAVHRLGRSSQGPGHPDQPVDRPGDAGRVRDLLDLGVSATAHAACAG
jgi:SSS family solute:Na+ symporter